MSGIPPSGTSPSPLPSSSSAVISFLTVPTMYTCGAVPIAWNFLGGIADVNPFRLVITNDQVSQGSSVSVQSVNETLSQVNPLSGEYTWNKVDVAPGRYDIVAYMSSSQVRSNDFSVLSGTDTSCLPTSTIPGSSISATSTSSSQQLPSSSISASPVQLSTTKSSNAGKITGGVVGGLAAVALILALLSLLRRRLSVGKGSAKWALANGRSRSFTKVHSPSASTGSFLQSNAVPADIPNDVSRTPPSSQEDIPTPIEKRFSYSDVITPLPAHVKHASTNSLLRSQRPRSMSSNATYRGLESGVPLQQRSNSNRRSIDSTFSALRQQSDMTLVTPSQSPDAQPPKELDRTSSGRRTSRKPVPIYDVADFNTSNSSGGASLGRTHPTTSLSSVTEQEHVHYLIPDAPLPRRD